MPSGKLSKTLSPERAAESISTIALGLATGRIRLGEDFSARPAGPVELRVKGKQSPQGGKVTIEVSWSAKEG